MGRTSKPLALILSLIIAVSCLTLLTVETATAYYTSSSIRISSPISTVAYDNPIDLSVYISERLLDWDGIDKIGTHSVLWIGYSLDDSSVITIMNVNDTGWGSGEIPPVIASHNLSDVPEGQHKIVAYARGYFIGSVGVYIYNIASKPNYFTVGDTVIPPPTPTPSPSPTTEPLSVKCNSVILNPSTNTSYTDVMPLNFTAEWVRGNWTQWIIPRYYYSIDNDSKVSITTEPFPYIDFTDNNPAIEVINDTIDVSNLNYGVHTLALYTNGTVNEANLALYAFNFTLSTTHFQVGNLFPSPTTSHSSGLPSEIIFGSAVLVVVIIVLSVLLLRRHRKIDASGVVQE